jgi:5'-nucleotidase
VILLVNDDGIGAPGLRELYRCLRSRLRRPVLVVAPREAQSARGHAITIDRGLQVAPVKEEGFFGFAVDGTPCDCVKLALTAICRTPPRLVVSGINDGPNVGRSLFYSGTVAAALEAAIAGLPALAVSKDLDGGDLAECAGFAAAIAAAILRRNDTDGQVVNLGTPHHHPARPLRFR